MKDNIKQLNIRNFTSTIAILSTAVTCKLLKLQACAIYRKKEFRNTLYAFRNDFYFFTALKTSDEN